MIFNVYKVFKKHSNYNFSGRNAFCAHCLKITEIDPFHNFVNNNAIDLKLRDVSKNLSMNI